MRWSCATTSSFNRQATQGDSHEIYKQDETADQRHAAQRRHFGRWFGNGPKHQNWCHQPLQRPLGAVWHRGDARLRAGGGPNQRLGWPFGQKARAGARRRLQPAARHFHRRAARGQRQGRHVPGHLHQRHFAHGQRRGHALQQAVLGNQCGGGQPHRARPAQLHPQRPRRQRLCLDLGQRHPQPDCAQPEKRHQGPQSLA